MPLKKLILLFVVLLLGLLFDQLPENTIAKAWFPFSDLTFTFQTYVYYIFEHLIKIILSYIVYAESVKYRYALWVFLLLQIGDLVDYLLTYNSVWAQLGSVPVSFNTLAPVIFGLAILRDGRVDD